MDLAQANINRTDAAVAEVDCEADKDLCARLEVRGYPTLVTYHKGELKSKYSGDRSLADLQSFLDGEAQKLNPSPVKLTNENFHSKTSDGRVWFVKAFAPWCGWCKKIKDTWIALSAANAGREDAAVGEIDCTEDKDICNELGIRGFPTLQIFYKGAVGDKFTGERDLPTLQKYLDDKVTELKAGAGAEGEDEEEEEEEEDEEEEEEEEEEEGEVAVDTGDSAEVVLTAQNFDEIVAAPGKATFIKFFAPWCGFCKQMAAAWKDLAQEVNTDQSKIIIASLNCDNEGDLCKKLSVDGYPTLKLFINGEDKAEYEEGDRSKDDLKKWVEEQAGTLIPTTTVLTDDDFASSTKDGRVHLVAFKTQWCGHCKKLKPHFDELAGLVAGNGAVSINEVDCDASKQTCQEYSVRGYPTIKAFYQGEAKADYKGDRSVADLKRFVEKTAEDVGASAAPTGDIKAQMCAGLKQVCQMCQ